MSRSNNQARSKARSNKSCKNNARCNNSCKARKSSASNSNEESCK